MKIYCLLFLQLFSSLFFSQTSSNPSSNFKNTSWFLSFNYGSQMSGIKDEDFVGSNYSPLVNISGGKWITPALGVQLGYKGFYFNTIADRIKHHYYFFYGEGLISLNNLMYPSRINRNWNLLIHVGPGYFYNHVYRRASPHINIGLQNSFQISENILADFDISSVVGWDIYQGNLDILPGITAGLIINIK